MIPRGSSVSYPDLHPAHRTHMTTATRGSTLSVVETLPYTREIVDLDDQHETLLMRWHAGICCAPHDHGAASGTIHIVSGHFVERHYRFDGASLKVTATLRHAGPAIIEVAPHTIHDMRSESGGVTVHHYAPRISGMRVFNHALRETLVVTDDCGAWVPCTAAQIVTRSPWRPME
jgi:cysteine dioxygenase